MTHYFFGVKIAVHIKYLPFLIDMKEIVSKFFVLNMKNVVLNVQNLLFLFFCSIERNTHTRKIERGSNTKLHYKTLLKSHGNF